MRRFTSCWFGQTMTFLLVTMLGASSFVAAQANASEFSHPYGTSTQGPDPLVPEAALASMASATSSSSIHETIDGTNKLISQGRSSPLSATFINPGKQGERFWDMVTDIMSAAAQDLNIALEILYAERSPYRLRELATETLTRSMPPHYLLLVNEEQAFSELLSIADTTHTKVLMLLNDLPAEHRYLNHSQKILHPSWIGSVIPDNHDAGKRMATLLLKEARALRPDTPLHALALIGDTRTPASIARNAGMLSGFGSDDALTIDRILEARWNHQDAERLTQQYLAWIKKEKHGVDIIWSANDAIAEGAIKALESTSIQPGKDTLVAGLNWSPEGIKMVADGRMLLTDGGHFMAGAWAMIMIRDHADNPEMLARLVTFPMSAITTHNVLEYGPLLLAPDWTRIDFKRYRLTPSNPRYHFDSMQVLKQLKIEALPDIKI